MKLISILEQVKWPKTMSSLFRSFLQGLLTKDTNKRLSWPELAEHEFVKNGIKSKIFLSNHTVGLLIL